MTAPTNKLDGAMMTDDLENMTPNQRRALDAGLAALDTMAATWAAEVRLHEIAKHFAAIADPDERATRIAAMVRQGFSEGAYRCYLDHKDQIELLSASKPAAPMQPTEAMLNAARDWSLKKYGQGIGSDAAIGCWQARAASPQPTVQDEERLASAVKLMRCLKRDLMHARRFGADTLANYRRACSSAEGDVEEWLKENSALLRVDSPQATAAQPAQTEQSDMEDKS